MSITLTPFLPLWVLLILLAGCGVLLGGGKVSRLRAMAGLVLVLALAGPRWDVITRQPLPDVVAVVVDDSASQQIGARARQTAEALAQLQTQLQQMPNLAVRVIHAGGNAALTEGTRLFQDLADIPAQRLAATILITDGIVHDVPRAGSAPLHVLLTGTADEVDRRIQMIRQPDFAVVGQNARLRFQVKGEAPSLPVQIRVDGVVWQEAAPMAVDQDLQVDIPIRHAGPNVVQIAVADTARDLSPANNHAVVVVPGIRDRLKVLLLSGVPHVGERMWRNLLKADPAVDLVHFTILRGAAKSDATPLDQLALIPFPVRELFEQKLPDFDLVILDRYNEGELPAGYLERLAQYVQNGGALLLVAGPEFADDQGLAQSALAPVLPASPLGPAIGQAFVPMIAPLGARHPVLAGLTPPWGRWLRHVPAQIQDGQVLLQTATGNPVLVLAHRGQGRVVQMLSDTGWLWARGWDGGGPYDELLRRCAHWLMQEPELAEDALTATVQDGKIQVRRQSLSPQVPDVTATGPAGQQMAVALTDQGNGVQSGSAAIADSGPWQISDGTHRAMAVGGQAVPLEWAELARTDSYVRDAVTASGGRVIRLDSDGVPALRQVALGQRASGPGWLGLIQHGDSVVTAVTQSGMWPSVLLLAVAAAIMVAAWRREGR